MLPQFFRRPAGQNKKSYLTQAEKHSRLMVAKLGDVMISLSRISLKTQEVNQAAGITSREMEKSTSDLLSIQGSLESMGEMIARQDDLVRTSASAVEEISASIVNVSHIAGNKKAAIQDLSQKIDRGSLQLQEAEGAILEVFRSLESVKKLASLIEGIAAKTNLLALNATIEAARSGEAGRGFSVVASEIRELARETGSKSQDIAETLNNLVDKITKAQDSSLGVGKVFHEIENTVETVQAGFNEITQSTEDLKLGAGEILSSTADLRELSGNLRKDSQSIMEASRQVQSVIREAGQMVAQTREGMDGVNRATGDMITMAQGLNQLNLENNQSLRSLLEEDEASLRLLMASLMSKHFHWLAWGRQLLLGDPQARKTDLKTPEACDLGRWLATEGPSVLGDSGIHASLEVLHRDFHGLLFQLWDKKESGDLEGAEAVYTRMIEISSKIACMLSGFQVRPVPQWSSALSVGVQTFDKHHQKLLSLVDQLKLLMRRGAAREDLMKVFGELLEYTVYHFSAEEAAFAHFGYPLDQEHRQAHRSLVDQAVALKASWERGHVATMMESLDFLVDWVMQHILGTDIKYGSWFKGKDVDAFLASRRTEA